MVAKHLFVTLVLAATLANCGPGLFDSSSTSFSSKSTTDGAPPDGSSSSSPTQGDATQADGNTDTSSGGEAGHNTDGSDKSAANAKQGDEPLPPPPKINFGMLVNDLNCTFCHLEVHGTVGSVAEVPAMRFDSHGSVFGDWVAAGAFKARDALSAPPMDNGLVISGKLLTNYDNSGRELPTNDTGKIAFPNLDFNSLEGRVRGQLTSPAAPSSLPSIAKVLKGNAVLVGTTAQPIVIKGDILVEGDLIIKGVYTGVGSIYVTGSIYIPANLKALHPSAMPYSDTPATADAQAVSDLSQGGKDALGLATAKSVFVGDIENYMDAANGTPTVAAGAHGARLGSLYTRDDALNFATSKVWDVYSWYPELQYEKLYETAQVCWTAAARSLVSGHTWGERTFNQIDAYLYAKQSIAGVNRAATWTINGGMIAQSMHIVSGAGSDSVGANAVCPPARINFDYRLRNGLQILEMLAPFFPER